MKYIATVVWEQMVLPDEPKVLPIQQAIDEKYYSHLNNKKLKQDLRNYINRNHIKATLKRMEERGEIIIDGDSIRRVA